MIVMGSDDLFKRSKALREYKRATGNRGKDRDRILIVCEGEKTEPTYFEGFKLTNVTVVGTGNNPIRFAIERMKELYRELSKRT